jgi:hypothetical protein
MRRLARHLFALCSAVSLLLCVAVCVLWVRSQWSIERVVYATRTDEVGEERTIIHERYWQLVSGAGVLVYADTAGDRGWDHLWPEWVRPHLRFAAGLTYKSDPQPQHPFRGVGHSFLGRIGFLRNHAVSDDQFGHVAQEAYAVPYWFMVSVSAILPATILIRLPRLLRVRGRTRSGRCPECGYDLRASPDRCPECGAPPVKSVTM